MKDSDAEKTGRTEDTIDQIDKKMDDDELVEVTVEDSIPDNIPNDTTEETGDYYKEGKYERTMMNKAIGRRLDRLYRECQWVDVYELDDYRNRSNLRDLLNAECDHTRSTLNNITEICEWIGEVSEDVDTINNMGILPNPHGCNAVELTRRLNNVAGTVGNTAETVEALVHLAQTVGTYLDDQKLEAEIAYKEAICGLAPINDFEDGFVQGYYPLDVEFSIDPSGYVYEGVPSNRLQGVTATVYYKETVEDMYGDKHEEVRMWDATEYGQQNPLITDEYGMYRWDVPQGLWQVKFEKEGYETTYSDWLPVPPPQLDVNIAMKQFVQPEVKDVRAYESGITIEFEKYMLSDSLNTNNIRVMKADSTWVNGQIEWANKEQVSDTDSLAFVSIVKFIPDTPFLPTDTVILTIDSHVVSYTGIQMEEDYIRTFCITNEVTGIEVDSLVRVLYGGEKELVINAIPSFAAAGKRLVVNIPSTMIASVNTDTLTFDVNGQATLTVKGELPGFTILSMQVDSTDIQAVTSVFVGNAAQITTIAPRASLASGIEVESGTTVALTCETANAVIYYTLDGSCPCDGGTRFTYTTPIVIDKDIMIKAMAFNPELGESEIVTYIYKLKDVEKIETQPVATSTVTCLSISGGVELHGVQNLDISVFNLQGILLHKALDVKTNKLFLKLPEGLYVVRVHSKSFKVQIKK